jgi:hypothetical protein
MDAEMIGPVAPGTKYGSWTILSVQCRSATAVCRCGAVRILSADAIASGEAAPCVPAIANLFRTSYRQIATQPTAAPPITV